MSCAQLAFAQSSDDQSAWRTQELRLDYGHILNRHWAKDIKPAENAMTLFWQAIGPNDKVSSITRIALVCTMVTENLAI